MAVLDFQRHHLDLTGENASEAVIEQVFERFCVGK